jgi:hypothetical protein
MMRTTPVSDGVRWCAGVILASAAHVGLLEVASSGLRDRTRDASTKVEAPDWIPVAEAESGSVGPLDATSVRAEAKSASHSLLLAGHREQVGRERRPIGLHAVSADRKPADPGISAPCPVELSRRARARTLIASENPLAARSARLVSNGDLCGDVFPREAKSDKGVVTLSLGVTRTGATTRAVVVLEQPPGQGFGRAARLCSERLRFQPAFDVVGRPVAAKSVVRLHFAR